MDPLVICIGIGVVWIACIFFQMSSLYRKGSPLNIVYWGSWICFALWYMKYIKGAHEGWNVTILIIVCVAIGMGILFTLFGLTEERPGGGGKKK
jgi:hypothetical protein